LKVKQIYNKKKRKSLLKKLEREKKPRKKPNQSNKNSFLDSRKWKKRWWLDLKPSRWLSSSRKSLKRLKKLLRRSSRHSLTWKKNLRSKRVTS
jgi:hypothetical protein